MRALALRPLARRSGGRADAPLLPTATCALRCIIEVLDMDGNTAGPGCRYGMLDIARSRPSYLAPHLTWGVNTECEGVVRNEQDSGAARQRDAQRCSHSIWRISGAGYALGGVPRWLGHSDPPCPAACARKVALHLTAHVSCFPHGRMLLTSTSTLVWAVGGPTGDSADPRSSAQCVGWAQLSVQVQGYPVRGLP